MKFKNLTRQYNSIKLDTVSEDKIRERVFDYFQQTRPATPTMSYHFSLFFKPALISLLVLFFIFTTGFGTIAVAKKSLPGDFLYSLKRVVEKSQMFLAFSSSQKVVLRAEILNNRFDEAKVLVKKMETGDKESESDFNILAANFNQELKILKEEIGEQILVEDGPFPAEDLLNTELLDQGSLPIQDQRQMFTVLPNEDIERLLTETRELLAEKNMALALARIEQVEKIVSGEEKVEPQEAESQEIELQEIQENEKRILESTEENFQFPALQPAEQSPNSELLETQSLNSQLPNLGSTGNLSKEKQDDFKVKIEKDSSAQTGMIREE